MGAARAVLGRDAQLGDRGELVVEREIGARATAVERERARARRARELAREEEQRRDADAAGDEDRRDAPARARATSGRRAARAGRRARPVDACAMRRVPSPTTLMRIDGRSPAVSRLIGRGSSGASPHVADAHHRELPGERDDRLLASSNVSTW